MVKPHIEAIFMAREFSEFSTEYSTKKSDFSDIRNNLDAIMHIRTEVERCEQELGALRTQKSNLVLFSAFLTEDERNAQTASIDTQISSKDILTSPPPMKITISGMILNPESI